MPGYHFGGSIFFFQFSFLYIPNITQEASNPLAIPFSIIMNGKSDLSALLQGAVFKEVFEYMEGICNCYDIGPDQLRSNQEADQHLCFHYRDSMIPLLSKS